MKLFCAVACLALFSHTAVAGDWKLVWSDEFDKPGLPDPAKWNFEQGFIRNREAQYYTKDRSENARVEDGMLIIEARKEHFPNSAYDPKALGREPALSPVRRVYLRKSDYPRPGQLDVWPDRSSGQTASGQGHLAGDLDSGDQCGPGRLAGLRRNRYHGVCRVRSGDHSCQYSHPEI